MKEEGLMHSLTLFPVLEGKSNKIEIRLSRFVGDNYESPWMILGCGGYPQINTIQTSWHCVV